MSHLLMYLGTAQVSLANWNQDEAWGGFGGPHCMVKGGYSSLACVSFADAPEYRAGVFGQLEPG